MSVNITVEVQTIFIFFPLSLVLSQLLYLVQVVNNVYILKKLTIYTCDVMLPMFLSRIYSRSNAFFLLFPTQSRRKLIR